MSCFSLQDIGGCGCTCPMEVEVLGCNAFPETDGLQVELISGGSTIETQSTDASGVATFTSTPTGTYDVKVTDVRTPSRWNTQTFTSQSLQCANPYGATSVQLTSVKTGYHCLNNGCGAPTADTLYDTDANGTWTLTYAGSGYDGAGWYGCATYTSMAGVVTSVAAGTCVKTTGTANTNYVIGIAASTGTVKNYWGGHDQPTITTSSTPTCSAGALDLNANIPVVCTGTITLKQASDTPTVTCIDSVTALDMSGTMPSTGTNSTANPGAGAYTITE